jgi:hypothetical protein
MRACGPHFISAAEYPELVEGMKPPKELAPWGYFTACGEVVHFYRAGFYKAGFSNSLPADDDFDCFEKNRQVEQERPVF